MNRKEFDNFHSDLLLDVGVSLQRNQGLYISTSYYSYPFACLVAQKAYQRGASYVYIDIQDKYLLRSYLDNKTIDDIQALPDFLRKIYSDVVSEKWAFLHIGDLEDNDVLKSVDIDKLGQYMKYHAIINEERRKAASADLHPWSLTMNPGPQWTKLLYPSESEVVAEKKIIDLFSHILHLGPDQIENWQKHTQKTREKKRKLQEKEFRLLYFQGPHINLEVSLLPGSLWVGGEGKTPEGQDFIANLPTEEVYTTPDYRHTQGHVYVTRPVHVFNTLLEDIYFEFKEGKVINYSCKDNQKILDKFFEVDEGSCFLGEIALVGIDSPIFQSQKIFHSILYDENASCHMALGNAYITSVAGADTLAPLERKLHGINQSRNHTDFMISNEQTDVYGIDSQGEKWTIIKKGQFVL